MEKKTTKLTVLKAFLQNPKEIIALGYQGLTRKKATVDYEQILLDKYNIKELPTVDLLDLFPGFHDTISVYSCLSGTSSMLELLVLKGLAARHKNSSYFEIGSFRGESIVCVSEVAADCTSLTLSAEEMKALTVPEDHIYNTGFFSKNLPNLTTFYSNSHTFDYSKLNGKKFDVVYVDGEISHQSYIIDTTNVFKQLKNDSSNIVWHEYLHNSFQVNHEILLAILDSIPKERHKDLYHISNTKFAVLLKGDFKTTVYNPPQHPTIVFRGELAGTRI